MKTITTTARRPHIVFVACLRCGTSRPVGTVSRTDFKKYWGEKAKARLEFVCVECFKEKNQSESLVKISDFRARSAARKTT